MTNDKITFSQKVKNEIIASERNTQPCCALAFLSAIIRGNGSLYINHDGIGFSLNSNNLEMLKLVGTFVKKIYGASPDITVSPAVKGKNSYEMNVANKTMLYDCGILREVDGLTQIYDSLDFNLLSKECCKRSFVKGLFLACGSVIVPELNDVADDSAGGTKYHFEFQLNSDVISGQLVDMLADFDFYLKITKHHDLNVVYLKDAESIGDLLVFMGARNAKLALENVIISRDIRNKANRASNCINANINKAVMASEKQTAAILKLIEKGQMGLLDARLQDCANARMENPEANLDELAQLLNITKSGVNHRLRKLVELAEDNDGENK